MHTKSLEIIIVAGARPNFIKISSLINAINKKKKEGSNIKFKLVHTGQHYNTNMSDSFFEQLNIPTPNYNMGIGGGSQSEQTAQILTKFEKILSENPCDIVIVVGDVTSTMACSIVAKKLHVRLAHVEAGIRSYDRKMPEEINRLITDSISDYFFTTTENASQNLIKEGHKAENIFLVGNTMVDTLLASKSSFFKPSIWDRINLKKGNFIVLTLHRPSNVDNLDTFVQILKEIEDSSNGLPVIFPVHPRTKKQIHHLKVEFKNLHFVEPLSYFEFNYLVQFSKVVITDSGGITEEATVLGIPCLTLRDSTERPETCTIGTNELIGTDPKNLKKPLEMIFQNRWKKGQIPYLWDGKTGERIVSILLDTIK